MKLKITNERGLTMNYIPRLGWTYFILVHIVLIPLTIYLGTFIKMRDRRPEK